MGSLDLPPTSTSHEAAAAHIRALLRGQAFPEALAAARAGLEAEPTQREFLLYAAVAQRYLGRTREALQTLERAQGHHPRFSRIHEERGRCYVDLRLAAEAIAAFRTAVNLNGSLPGSWRMLESLYRMTGQTDLAAEAGRQLAVLQGQPPPLVTASGLFADEELDEAEAIVRHFLLENGDHVDGMRLLARIGIARKVFDDPEILLAAAVEMAPDHTLARKEYAAVLVEVHKYSEARRELERLLEFEPHDARLKTLYATSIVGLGEYERAIAIYRELLQESPADCDLRLWIAHALKTLGLREEAIESYRAAAACRGDFGDAYWSLANLKTYRFTDDELQRMSVAESAATTGRVDRYQLCFAIGKALEDRGRYAESFRYYATGNDLKHSEGNSRVEIVENNTARQIEVCTPEFFAARRGWGEPAPDPIFIVGLPRSGSTLLEQILASHSRVEGTQELSTIQQIVTQLRGRDPSANDSRYPQVLTQLGAADCRRLGELYLERTRVYRTTKPLFIDKMPNNFRHLGLIRLILPNAKIIDARREPVACCFGNFKQLFARGQEFTYSFSDIARYYRTYLDLMRHWNRVLPGTILTVEHEDVVDDLEGSVRRLLAFCGLEFEPACVEFHKNSRSVRTASSEQVRQPINRAGLDQWKHYEPWLQPLRDGLGDAVTRYRDDDHR
jgi:tetratricopeptide (TPR) repeat protein